MPRDFDFDENSAIVLDWLSRLKRIGLTDDWLYDLCGCTYDEIEGTIKRYEREYKKGDPQNILN